MKAGRTIATVAIVVLISATALTYILDQQSLTSILNPFQQYYVPNLIQMTFYRNFSFSTSQSGNGNYFLYMTLPENQSLQSGSVLISHSSNVLQNISQSTGRTYAKMTLSPGDEYVNFTYRFSSQGKDWQGTVADSGNISQIPGSLKAEYNHPEYFNTSQNQSYEVINPSIFRNLTLSITANQSSVAGKLRAIYDYIVNNYRYNISYNLGNIPLTSLQVYQGKIGDCEELSYLFESMSRSIGIPSWTQYGLLVQKSGSSYTIGNHAWIQTYIPLKNGSGEYVNIDLTVEVGHSDLGLGFLVKYPNALIEWTDNGNSTDMVDFHTFLEYPEFGLGQISYSEDDGVQSFVQTGQTVINTNSSALFTEAIVARTWKCL